MIYAAWRSSAAVLSALIPLWDLAPRYCLGPVQSYTVYTLLFVIVCIIKILFLYSWIKAASLYEAAIGAES